jgi:hypothetical protein
VRSPICDNCQVNDRQRMVITICCLIKWEIEIRAGP